MSRNRFARLLLGVVLAFVALAAGASVQNVEAFARLPVQDGGRVMPMDTYARMRLLEISGKSSFTGAPAHVWFARLLFAPGSATNDRVFLVNDASILEGIVSNATGRARFSFGELLPGLGALREQTEQILRIDETNRTPAQSETARVYNNAMTYFALSYSFSFTRTDDGIAVTNAAVRERMKLTGSPDDRYSALDVYLHADSLAGAMEGMVATNAANWTPEQTAVFEISSLLYNMGQMYQGLPPAVLPPHEGEETTWAGPWDAIATGLHEGAMREELIAWQNLARSYLVGDQTGFDSAARAIEQSVHGRAKPDRGLAKIDLELLKNRVDPFYRAELFYGFAFLVGLLAVGLQRRSLRLGALLLVVLALLPHTFGIVARMLIMGRPPVTNLYATFIFVGWVCVLLGLIVEAFQRNALGSLLASLAGLVLLLVSGRFAEQGDTMGVMVAVLDSNFWLATHVVCISIGYAGCVFAGLFGAVYLIVATVQPPGHPLRTAIMQVCYGILAFGLICSFLGTMLGGVWADQSWGRFWGWDPKENGALLIVLWCALLFHARIAGIVREVGFAAGAVLGIIVVLMAWLGINLLGVGLHNYGFTSTLAYGFWIGVSVVAAFVVLILPFVKRGRATGPQVPG